MAASFGEVQQVLRDVLEVSRRLGVKAVDELITRDPSIGPLVANRRVTEEDLERLFDLLLDHYLSEDASRSFERTQNVAVCRELVQLLDGRVEFENHVERLRRIIAASDASILG
jgi:hypothetical protein